MFQASIMLCERVILQTVSASGSLWDITLGPHNCVTMI